MRQKTGSSKQRGTGKRSLNTQLWLSMSNGKTLIAYVTKGGVTEEAAREIANVLRGKYGLEVDLINLKKNASPNIAQYVNIIVGSGVRIGKVYTEALRFLEKDFKDKRTVFFISSGEAGDAKTHDSAVTKYVTNVLVNYPNFKPIATEAFGGRIKILGKMVSDSSDMAKVRVWAEELGKKFTQ
jgi:menaquinone-dependent protoporphyrinogen IX oxidase